MGKRLYCILSLLLVLALASANLVHAADPSLVVWWPLNEGQGTVAYDASGNGNDGTFVNGPEWVDGLLGGALHFRGDAETDSVEYDLGADTLWTAGTVALWVKPDSLAQDTWSSCFTNYFPNSAGIQFDVDGTDPGNYRVNPGGIIFGPATLEWTHLAMAWDGTDATVYYNAEAANTGTLNDSQRTFNRFAIGVNRNSNNWLASTLDDFRVYDRALTSEEIAKAMKGDQGPSSAPSPEDGASDIPRQVLLGWAAGEFAASHDVYGGTSFDDVNDASRANPMGVLLSQGQADTSYDLTGLDFGQTFYWRVDEVNAAPDNTIFKGDVWSFTTELFAYPIEGVVATSNGTSDADSGPEKAVDGSGLNADDQHSVERVDMWTVTPIPDEPLTIQFEFDRVHKLHQMLVWNYNVAFELLLGFGVKDATVEYSADGAEWTVLGDVVLAQATATDTYTANSTVDFAGVAAQYVKLTINSAYGAAGQFGLSEVRFLSIPVHPSNPDPAVDATDVAVTGAALSWRAGREAASHDVYLSDDPNALALIDTVADSTADPGALDLATTYYWRIDEVNDAQTITTWAGNVWTFTTESSIVVEDFESYTDDIDAGEAIFLTWVDGYSVAGNNSQVGYLESPFAEQTTVHGGAQAMPLIYANADGGISEATRTFDAAQDWTKHGVKGLVIRFYGNPANTAGTLYAKINDTKVTYDGDADTITKMPWQTWYIDLTGLNVASVTELTIGIEGGEGTLFVDDITLTPNERTQATPVEPDPTNLISHFAFEGDASDSTGAHPGTLVGPPTFVAGKVGQAISLNGTGDHVELTGYQGVLGASAVTVSAWVKTTNTATEAIMGWGPNVGGQRFGFRINAGRLRFEHHGGNIQGDTVMNDGAWHHVAVTIQANATISYPEVILWLDGQDDTRPTTDLDPPFDLTADLDVRIGSRPASGDRFFMGQIDELYLYDRVLSQGEIAYQAGRTQPFDVE